MDDAIVSSPRAKPHRALVQRPASSSSSLTLLSATSTFSASSPRRPVTLVCLAVSFVFLPLVVLCLLLLPSLLSPGSAPLCSSRLLELGVRVSELLWNWTASYALLLRVKTANYRFPLDGLISDRIDLRKLSSAKLGVLTCTLLCVGI